MSVSANSDETAASPPMAVVAPATSVPATAVPSSATSAPLASGGWFIEPTSAAELVPSAGLSQSSSNENGAVSSGAVPLKAINPQAVDKIDLPSVVDHETNLLGLGDLNASLDALMSDQLGVGIRRLP